MSTIPHLDSASALSASARTTSGFRGFLRSVWSSFERHSELQVMLASGYSEGLSRRNLTDGAAGQRRVTVPLR